MGFAGQVFAARMAVGLAVPSKSALTGVGGMLAKGASAIYNKLAQERKSQAAARVAAASKEADRLAEVVKSKSKISSAQTVLEAKRGVMALEDVGGQARQAFEGDMSQMQKVMTGGTGDKLFSGIEKGMKPMDKLMRMTRNYATMSEGHQKRAVAQSKMYVQAKAEDVKATAKSFKTLLKEREEIIASGKATKKQLAVMDKGIEKKKQDVKASAKILKLARRQEKMIDRVAKATKNAGVKTTEELKQAKEKLAKATKELTEAEAEQAEMTDELDEESKGFGETIGTTVNQGLQGYRDVLVESVAIMSAFYYKINQNTQALIEFERELFNANSVFGLTNDELFKTSNMITEFGQQFGMEMQNGATGLYQLASAGLSANEAMQVLPHTLKLSMAVQGDHNTISKLTTQTIAGFGMEMNEAGRLTDKFAHAIQKSLIEYEDLSSAVKFALPFFTSTGQSIDQLLGALQVLTNRALEAGIAGRGLRQALAEFAENAENNDAAFRKMGISILDSEGNMKQLTDIAAEFARVVGEETVSNTELLTALIDDLNVRGATAFVHLVQASDEFTEAVHATENAGGELDKMVKIQNESMGAQIQILKNNVQAIFQLRDATYEGTGFLNGFHEATVNIIKSLSGLIVVEEEGQQKLTEFGESLRTIVIESMYALHEVILQVVDVIKEFSKEGLISTEMIRLYTLPLRILLDVIQLLGPDFTKLILTLYIYNKVLMLGAVANVAFGKTAMTKVYPALMAGIAHGAKTAYAAILKYAAGANVATFASRALAFAMRAIPIVALVTAVVLVIYYLAKWMKKTDALSKMINFFSSGLKSLGDIVINYVVFSFNMWMGIIDKIVGGLSKIAGFGGGIIDSAKGLLGFANGGYVTGMANGGRVGKQPYMVGERGPELFMPSSSGQILNTQKTQKILAESTDLAGPAKGSPQVMNIQSLVVSEADINQSSLNIDSFASNPAIRRTSIGG